MLYSRKNDDVKFMPMPTTIYSPDDLKPFIGKFVKFKHASSGIHHFQVGLIDGEFSSYAVWLTLNNTPWMTLEEFESYDEIARGIFFANYQGYIKLSDLFFLEFSRYNTVTILELSQEEIQKQIALFNEDKRSLLPTKNCPDKASAIK